VSLTFSVEFTSPSNIALIKYWGKKNPQLPLNPSLSMTLSKCNTQMKVEYSESLSFDLELFFENKRNEKFENKIKNKLLENFSEQFPWIKTSKLKIISNNTFPHSSGIASSASSMSALALCLISIDEKISNKKRSVDEFNKLASYWARMFSGSASRSIYSEAALWGKSNVDNLSSDDYAISFNDFHPIFKNLGDFILIVDASEKSVSSSAGHELMNGHPYKDARIAHANQNLLELVKAMKEGDFHAFLEVVEREALDLHGLMMTSRPSFILLHPNTLKIISIIKKAQVEKNIKMTFTIDAGPNIHLLYPHFERSKVQDFIKNEILPIDQKIYFIDDQMGKGPMNLNE
jgi:diphosphomevalonate decarboxylase